MCLHEGVLCMCFLYYERERERETNMFCLYCSLSPRLLSNGFHFPQVLTEESGLMPPPRNTHRVWALLTCPVMMNPLVWSLPPAIVLEASTDMMSWGPRRASTSLLIVVGNIFWDGCSCLFCVIAAVPASSQSPVARLWVWRQLCSL